MSSTTTATAETTVKPTTYRLPAPGALDPHFNMSRAYYYVGEKRGYWKLIHVRAPGRRRGITLVPFAAVAAWVKSQASNAEIESTAGEVKRSEQMNGGESERRGEK